MSCVHTNTLTKFPYQFQPELWIDYLKILEPKVKTRLHIFISSCLAAPRSVSVAVRVSGTYLVCHYLRAANLVNRTTPALTSDNQFDLFTLAIEIRIGLNLVRFSPPSADCNQIPSTRETCSTLTAPGHNAQVI